MNTFLGLLRFAVGSLLLICCFACNSEPKEQAKPETNVVKDYVNVPKEKALDAKKKVEDVQDSEADQLDDVAADDEPSEGEGEGEE